MAVIECVPNVSEGRRAGVIEACAAAIRGAGARLLDVHRDPDHNRSVYTFAGEPGSVRAAALALFEAALPVIDMRTHEGVHPRLGAVDVVPFVPLAGATMADCVGLARDVAAEVAARHHLPIYFYEEAAARPDRRRLEVIRRGGFEGLAAKMASPGWTPDAGPAAPHPTAGATVIGARPLLIAFNVNLASDRVEMARAIARAVRESSGGLPHVKAMGVRLTRRGIAQVSINLTRCDLTPLHVVMDHVRAEAARHGVAIAGSEVIGLVPEAAVLGVAAAALSMDAAELARRVLRLPEGAGFSPPGDGPA